jgi:hypothetical protein
MHRLVMLALLMALGCAGCGSSMSAAPVLQPGAFNERTVDDRGLERIGIDFVADTHRNGNSRGN